MVKKRKLRALIRRCLHQDPQKRPSMEEIIGELEQFKMGLIGSDP